MTTAKGTFFKAELETDGKGTVISNNTSPVGLPVEASGKKWSLEELQALVGGYIQIIYLKDDVQHGLPLKNPTTTQALVMDEEGKLKGKNVNILATERMWKAFPDAVMADWVVGDAILVESKDIA
jgi:hypothetical protein